MKDLSLHILDIAQNSIRANATSIRIIINESVSKDLLQIIIEDNGDGIAEENLTKVTDPFFTSRTTRKVGLGLSLLKQNAERCYGTFHLKSGIKQGTTIEANFAYSHIDRPTLGDIAGIITILCTSNSTIKFVYHHLTDCSEYIFNSEEVKEALEETPINDPSIFKFIKEMIQENIKEIRQTL
jgi:hypothetical protein